MAAPGRCQETPGRVAVRKDLPAALTHCCHKKLLLPVLKMTGELAPLGSQLEDRGRGLAPGFHTLSSKILLLSLVNLPVEPSFPSPTGPMAMQGIERMLGPSVWGRGGDEMKWLWDIRGTVYPMSKLKLMAN